MAEQQLDPDVAAMFKSVVAALKAAPGPCRIVVPVAAKQPIRVGKVVQAMLVEKHYVALLSIDGGEKTGVRLQIDLTRRWGGRSDNDVQKT